ncbi:hypothetical protein EJB05_28991, partial [Eragrostis curvula]
MGAAASTAAAVNRRVCAHRLFGEMPLGEGDTGGAPPAAGCEGIDVLPDGVLAHILGFLPAEEAVRTSVLARRWRHLWKSATSLHVVAADGHFLGSVEKLVEFMDRLLPLREGASLDTCNLHLGDFSSEVRWHYFQVSDAEEDVLCRIDAWFRQVAACRVRFLRLVVCCEKECGGCPEHALLDLPLVSRHLKRLELRGVRLGSSLLDFSSCPVLEHLVFEWCDLSDAASTISFRSLKHLNMTSCMLKWDSRICIDAPNLVSFRLDNFAQMTPMLESMPLLVDAFVNITRFCGDQCNQLWHEYCDCEFCVSSESIGDDNSSSVLLKGLSEAENLTLVSEPIMFIFRMDLRWCPTFSKLKNLLLNEYWCVPDDFHALACILEHSPLLEKLTLQLFSKGPAHKVQLKGSINPRLRCASISEHLKTVEVMCEVVDEWILKVLKFLRMFNLFHPSCFNISDLCHVRGNKKISCINRSEMLPLTVWIFCCRLLLLSRGARKSDLSWMNCMVEVNCNTFDIV